MRKFRVEVYDATNLENVYECEVEDLGQAMIQVMSQGHDLYEVKKTKERYLWHILNMSVNEGHRLINSAYGAFTKKGRVVIKGRTPEKLLTIKN